MNIFFIERKNMTIHKKNYHLEKKYGHGIMIANKTFFFLFFLHKTHFHTPKKCQIYFVLLISFKTVFENLDGNKVNRGSDEIFDLHNFIFRTTSMTDIVMTNKR